MLTYGKKERFRGGCSERTCTSDKLECEYNDDVLLEFVELGHPKAWGGERRIRSMFSDPEWSAIISKSMY